MNEKIKFESVPPENIFNWLNYVNLRKLIIFLVKIKNLPVCSGTICIQNH